MKIGRNETREIIVDMRENEGLSYGDIAKELEIRYGIKRSRQAVHGIHKRYKERAETEAINKLLIRNVICMYCLGYNMTEIVGLMEEEGTYYAIRKIITENEESIERTERKIRNRVLTLIFWGEASRETFKKYLNCRGHKIKDAKLREYLSWAYMFLVKEAVIRELIRIYRDTDSIELIAEIVEQTEVPGLNMTEVRARIRAIKKI